MIFELTIGLNSDEWYEIIDKCSARAYFVEHKHPMIDIYKKWTGISECDSYFRVVKKRIEKMASAKYPDLMYPSPIIVVQSKENTSGKLYNSLKFLEEINHDELYVKFLAFCNGQISVNIPKKYASSDGIEHLKKILVELPDSEVLDYRQIIQNATKV